MDRFHRFEQEAPFTASAKAVSIMFILGVLALLATHTTEPRHDATLASVAVSVLPAREVPVPGADLADGYEVMGPRPNEVVAAKAAR